MHSSFMCGFVLVLQPPVCIPLWSMQRTTRYLSPCPQVTVHWIEKNMKGENDREKEKVKHSDDKYKGNTEHQRPKHDAETPSLENKVSIIFGNYG